MHKSSHPCHIAVGAPRHAEGLGNFVMHYSLVEKNEPQTSAALSVSNIVINPRKDALFPPQPEDGHISVGN